MFRFHEPSFLGKCVPRELSLTDIFNSMSTSTISPLALIVLNSPFALITALDQSRILYSKLRILRNGEVWNWDSSGVSNTAICSLQTLLCISHTIWVVLMRLRFWCWAVVAAIFHNARLRPRNDRMFGLSPYVEIEFPWINPSSRLPPHLQTEE